MLMLASSQTKCVFSCPGLYFSVVWKTANVNSIMALLPLDGLPYKGKLR